MTGTTLNASGGGGGGGTFGEYEADFGASGKDEGSFTVTEASCTSASKILVSVSGNAPTSKDQDELEMDSFTMWALPGSGSFTLFMRSVEGPVHDKFKVFYTLG